MPDVTIIADDLTGAADCGIAFTLAGLPTFVSIGSASASVSARIVAVDTDSRALPASAAEERAHAAARVAYRKGSRTIYKKIDSTLRGSVGPELAATHRAATDALGSALVILCPAFPGTGRTVREGRVLVNGVPLEQTEVWRNSGMRGPSEPVAMLSAAGLRADAIPLEAVRGDLRQILSRTGAQAVLCDAESERDLAGIARAGAALSTPVIWSGSAGLARHLPAALGLRPSEPAAEPDWPDGPVLALVGSRSSIAREQARLLAADTGLESFVLDPAMLLAGEGDPSWARAGTALDRALDRGNDALLLIEVGTNVDLAQAPLLAAALGRIAAARGRRIGGLIATGGDIARAVLGAIGASGLHLLGEVEPGVPIGFTDTARALPIVTKAGAFGTAATLQRCRAALRRRMEGRA
jgi:4-hydroxythreonine-4-phosphate dehydrogenase